MLLGPEMRSTGEVMGTASSFGLAYAKAELGAGEALPTSGTVFLSTHDRDKQALLPVMQAAKPRPNLTFTYADPPEPPHPYYRMVLVFDAAYHGAVDDTFVATDGAGCDSSIAGGIGFGTSRLK